MRLRGGSLFHGLECGRWKGPIACCPLLIMTTKHCPGNQNAGMLRTQSCAPGREHPGLLLLCRAHGGAPRWEPRRLGTQPHLSASGMWVNCRGLAMPLHPERCHPNSPKGVPAPWRIVPFPASPGSVTILDSLINRVRGMNHHTSHHKLVHAHLNPSDPEGHPCGGWPPKGGGRAEGHSVLHFLLEKDELQREWGGGRAAVGLRGPPPRGLRAAGVPAPCRGAAPQVRAVQGRGEYIAIALPEPSSCPCLEKPC